LKQRCRYGQGGSGATMSEFSAPAASVNSYRQPVNPIAIGGVDHDRYDRANAQRFYRVRRW
jgi:hypothetical protein